jgi:folate-dependent phosphoribosylglycinamide formyltransferase PurN
MKVALLTPRYVSLPVLELAEALRSGSIGLQAVIGFDVPGPVHNRLSSLARRWRIVNLTPRERVLRTYDLQSLAGSVVSNRDVLKYAKARGIPWWNPTAMNHPSMQEAVKATGCSIVASVGAGIVGNQLLDLPGVSFINAHPGRLPELPGRDTAAWSVYFNEPVHGSVHRMAPKVDAGDLLVVRPVAIGRPRTVQELHYAAWASTWALVTDALKGLRDGRLSFVPQNLRRRRHMCYRMHPELLRAVARRLRDDAYFAAHEKCLDEYQSGLSH